ncbi:MAG: hypothetical protein HFH68_01475 [Lachnospiraceae bacterium]|nr:hypothetical protein [Lachnospiraceae bacterium]
MGVLFKLVLVVAVLTTIFVLLSYWEEDYLDSGCYKKSVLNCSNCKKECKWKYLFEKVEDMEGL